MESHESAILVFKIFPKKNAILAIEAIAWRHAVLIHPGN